MPVLVAESPTARCHCWLPYVRHCRPSVPVAESHARSKTRKCEQQRGKGWRRMGDRTTSMQHPASCGEKKQSDTLSCGKKVVAIDIFLKKRIGGNGALGQIFTVAHESRGPHCSSTPRCRVRACSRF